ncbi:VENN motif pre-toxin domain-containing protein [Yersinia ruckeri]|nr:VENN motif pre-toxin domain-containing protein [Yersinia ruckeri]
MDIARTQGDINGLEKALKHHPELKGDAKALRETKEYQAAMQKYGTGSPLQQGLQAATAAIQGLAGGDMAKALAGASAPYLAEVIKKSTGNNQEANLMAHAVLGAVVAKINGDSALSGASGAAMGEYIAQQMYPGVKREDLSEEQRQTLSALSTLASGLSGGLAGDSTADAVAGAQAGKNAVENNALSDIVQAQSEGKTLEQKAGEYVEAENERYKKANCGGMSAEACSVKMYTERREALKETASLGADFVPIVGDIKSFAEAQSALDYLAAAIGIIPGAGDAAGKVIKAAEIALKKGDVAEASKLINKASNEISAKTPTGSKGNPLNIIDGQNKPVMIGNRDYSGHSLDRMQKQGITPTTVENAIRPENAIQGKRPGTTAYYDSKNNITVIADTKTGTVVTVDFGRIKQ